MSHRQALRLVLNASGVIGILFALLLLFGTDAAILGFNLGEPTVPAIVFARSTGAAIVAIWLINILATFDRGSPALRAILVGNVVIHVLSIVVDYGVNYERNFGAYVVLALHVYSSSLSAGRS